VAQDTITKPGKTLYYASACNIACTTFCSGPLASDCINCAAGTYVDGPSCTPCTSGCTLCSGADPLTQCSSCDSAAGFVLHSLPATGCH